jgi:hypothetical protein
MRGVFGFLSVVVALVAGGVAVVLSRRNETPDVKPSGGATDARGASRATPAVLNRERAAGVRPELLTLLDAWEREGTHAVMVAPDGGARIGPEAAAKQAAFFKSGASKAATLADTPHGRGAALDVYPVGFNPGKSMDSQPDMRARFRVFGEWAERKGFVWGGRWASFGPDGDAPHIELQNWRRFPMPAGNA